MGLIDDEIESHYRQANEAERLSNEFGELEEVRTQSILSRHLPSRPAVIVDVGGAAGVYAFPLAEQGYQVHLIDPVELHLEQARSRSASSGISLASITRGDARRLGFADGGADAVLMLGPLYHLVESADRREALLEARRVLKSGGVLFAAAISRFASLIDGLSRGFLADEAFREIVKQDLLSGIHRNLSGQADYFTTAYFHRPEELAAELNDVGFEDVDTCGGEGPVWMAARLCESWNDPAQRKQLLEFLMQTENESSLLGASAHLLAVAHRG